MYRPLGDHATALAGPCVVGGGFCEGSGISKAEGMLLQTEIPLGCQTIYSFDKKTKIIRNSYTEEDSSNDNLLKRKKYY